jgi:hypothetical protein
MDQHLKVAANPLKAGRVQVRPGHPVAIDGEKNEVVEVVVMIAVITKVRVGVMDVLEIVATTTASLGVVLKVAEEEEEEIMTMTAGVATGPLVDRVEIMKATPEMFLGRVAEDIMTMIGVATGLLVDLATQSTTQGDPMEPAEVTTRWRMVGVMDLVEEEEGEEVSTRT